MSVKENRISDLKQRLLELRDQVSITGKNIELHQQEVKTKNLSFSGGNGRLCIKPNTEGYDISLEGQSIQKQMYPFMKELCGKECDGYKQKNTRLGQLNSPFWRVRDFDLVRKAVIHYAGTGR